MRDVIVLGAGMVGVSSALQLRRRGWSVVLVDRNAPGRETSYGNAGIIQSEAVEPYAFPRDLPTLLRYATGSSNDVHYQIRALPDFLGPLLHYWWNSAPKRHREISWIYSEMIAQATAAHQPLIQEAGSDALIRRDGYRAVYRSGRAMEKAIADAKWKRERYGVAVKVMKAAELTAAEPSLRHGGVGAIHWLEPWSIGDPGGLVSAYADLFVRAGGQIVSGDAASLETRQGGGWQVRTVDGTVEAGDAVVALGPWTPALAGRFGYRIPMLRKRGYHMHYEVRSSLDLPLRDAERGYFLAPMRQGLRLSTGAELALPDARETSVQLDRAESAASDLLELGRRIDKEPWAGTRPCTPDMLPVVGAAPRHAGLWFHCGHGHQGITLGPVTARLLAELMEGETPHIANAHLLSPARF